MIRLFNMPQMISDISLLLYFIFKMFIVIYLYKLF